MPPDTPEAIDALVGEALDLTAELHRSSATLCGKYTCQQKPTACTVTLPSWLSGVPEATEVHQFALRGRDRPGLIVVPGSMETPTGLINSDRFEWLHGYEMHGSNTQTITVPEVHPAFSQSPNVFYFQLPPTAQGYTPLLITPAYGLGPGTE